ncbi:MAG: hypothetical protein HOZ81_08415, partial [Streptomyces sp.]|nr:hypothetical protein [Streptomyces sp.]
FTQVAAYVQLITDGKVDVNAQAYPLSQISQAWAAGAGPRPVLVAD